MPSDQDQKQLSKTWQFDEKGQDGIQYSGKFTCNKMTIASLREVGITKARLNGGYFTVYDEDGNATGKGLDPQCDYLNTMWAECKVALTVQPAWFDDSTLYDVTILQKVHKVVSEFENSFRVHRTDGGASETSSERESEEQKKLESLLGEMVEEDVPTIHKKR